MSPEPQGDMSEPSPIVITDDPYIEELEQAVATAKRNEQWRKDYNMNSAWYMDAVEDGIEIGEERGREQGLEQGRTDLIQRMLKNGKTEEEIAAFCDYPIEEIHQIAEKLSIPT